MQLPFQPDPYGREIEIEREREIETERGDSERDLGERGVNLPRKREAPGNWR